MSVLLELPHDLVREIVQEWLGLTERGKLDASISSVSQRSTLMKIFSQLAPLDMDEDEKNYELPITLYNWIYTRDLKMLWLAIQADDFDASEKKLRYNVKWDNVDSLELFNYRSVSQIDTICHFVSECTQLFKLVFHDEVIFHELCARGMKCSVLRIVSCFHLRFSSCKSIESVLLKLLKCRHFMDFSMEVDCDSSCNALLEELIGNNPTLQVLRLCCDFAVLKAVNFHCINMKCIVIESHEDVIPMALVKELIDKFDKIDAHFICNSQEFEYWWSGPAKNLALIDFEADEVMDAVSCVSNLTKFEFSSFGGLERFDEVLNQLKFHSSTTLKALTVGKTVYLPFDVVRRLLTELPLLESLAIAMDVEANDDDVGSLFQRSQSLCDIQVHFVQKEKLSTVSSILAACPLLIHFEFTGLIASENDIEDCKQALVNQHSKESRLEGSVRWEHDNGSEEVTVLELKDGQLLYKNHKEDSV